MTLINWRGLAIFIAYYGVGAGSIALSSHFHPRAKEIIRKAYHLMACCSAFILLFLFDQWYEAVFTLVIFAGLLYIVVPLGGRLPVIKRLSIGRKDSLGEVLAQAGLFVITLAILLITIWGGLGQMFKFHILVGMITLGIGDAAAALIGKRFGRRQLKLPFVDRNKTLAGSIAMIVTAFGSITALLLIFTDMPLMMVIISALVLAVVGTVIEAVSVAGIDTITIPLGVSFASVLLELLYNLLLG